MTDAREAPTEAETERESSATVQRPKVADDGAGAGDPMAWRESDLKPVKIRGKPLSQTVIEDRR